MTVLTQVRHPVSQTRAKKESVKRTGLVLNTQLDVLFLDTFEQEETPAGLHCFTNQMEANSTIETKWSLILNNLFANRIQRNASLATTIKN